MAESDSSIYGGLIANGLIAITKFAAAFSGSSAMLSEGIYQVKQIYIEAANLSK